MAGLGFAGLRLRVRLRFGLGLRLGFVQLGFGFGVGLRPGLGVALGLRGSFAFRSTLGPGIRSRRIICRGPQQEIEPCSCENQDCHNSGEDSGWAAAKVTSNVDAFFGVETVFYVQAGSEGSTTVDVGA